MGSRRETGGCSSRTLESILSKMGNNKRLESLNNVLERLVGLLVRRKL